MATDSKKGTPQSHADADSQPQADETTFKREGPVPAGRDTGDSVDDMNRAAEQSIVRNVEPDEAVD